MRRSPVEEGKWYYVPIRYPNSLPDSIPARVHTRKAAKEAVRLADEVVAFVRCLLSDKR
jgi:HEPN domain-containing protein